MFLWLDKLYMKIISLYHIQIIFRGITEFSNFLINLQIFFYIVKSVSWRIVVGEWSLSTDPKGNICREFEKRGRRRDALNRSECALNSRPTGLGFTELNWVEKWEHTVKKRKWNEFHPINLYAQTYRCPAIRIQYRNVLILEKYHQDKKFWNIFYHNFINCIHHIFNIKIFWI